MEMKSMEYKRTRKPCREYLYKGYYRDVPFAIVSYQTHPCAYVYIKDQGDNSDDYDLWCHGGCTYAGSTDITAFEIDECSYSGRWVGWDYAHFDDYMARETMFSFSDDLKKWTTEEIYEEVKEAIDNYLSSEE